MKYDFLIVGSGLFGSVFAYEMTKKGKKCLVIERRDHIGGNVYTVTQTHLLLIIRANYTTFLSI